MTQNLHTTTQALDINGFRVWDVCPINWSSQPTKGCIFFSHAAGVCSETYLSFLQLWSQNSGQRIFAMDCRGFGGSAGMETFEALSYFRKSVPDLKSALFGDPLTPVLREDLFSTFCSIRERIRKELSNSQNVDWTLSGHSMGGWLSLLEAPRCFVSKLVLFDISILPSKLSVFWTLACLARQRQIHTLAKVARTRKVCYRHKSEAQRVFRRSPMFRGWEEKDLDAYLDSHFAQTEYGFQLKHDPDWEASVLECQQPSATLGFLEIPEHVRVSLNVKFIVGERSEACTTEGSHKVKSMFPNAQWIVLPEAKHMFPFTHKATLMRLLAQLTQQSQEEQPNAQLGKNEVLSLALKEPTENLTTKFAPAENVNAPKKVKTSQKLGALNKVAAA